MTDFAKESPSKQLDDKALEAAPVFGIIDPEYARIYTIARLLAWQEGYALTLHGSFTRDLDLVAVPWTGAACEPEHLTKRIAEATGLKANGDPSTRPHGRLTWTLVFSAFGDPRFVDLSVMSRATTASRNAVWNEAIEAAAKAAEAEKLTGIPDKADKNLVSLMRAGVTCTKNSIAEKIRALRLPEHGEGE